MQGSCVVPFSFCQSQDTRQQQKAHFQADGLGSLQVLVFCQHHVSAAACCSMQLGARLTNAVSHSKQTNKPAVYDLYFQV